MDGDAPPGPPAPLEEGPISEGPEAGAEAAGEEERAYDTPSVGDAASEDGGSSEGEAGIDLGACASNLHQDPQYLQVKSSFVWCLVFEQSEGALDCSTGSGGPVRRRPRTCGATR